MHCPTTEQLAEYQLGVLSDVRALAVQQHVASCQTCQNELAALTRTDSLVSALPEPPPRGDLWPGIAARLEPKRPLTFFPRWRRIAVSMGVAAGLLAAVLTAKFGWHQPPVTPSAPASYVAEHAFLSAQDPLADRAGIGIMLASNQTETP